MLTCWFYKAQRERNHSSLVLIKYFACFPDTPPHDDMLLRASWPVRLAGKGRVPTTCEASDISLALFSVIAGIFLLASFAHSPVTMPTHTSTTCLSAQPVSLVAHTGVGYEGEVVKWESSWSHPLETKPETGWAAIQLRGRWSSIFAMKLREKMKWCVWSEKNARKVTSLGLTNGHKQSDRPLFYV